MAIGLRTAIGDRPARVTVQIRPAPVKDGEGQFTYPEPWPDGNPPGLFVQIRAASASDLERARDGTVAAMATHTIVGPAHPQIATGVRFRDGARTFEVLGFTVDGARMECLVAEDVT
jgi:Phage head-tail joining protein